MPLVIPPDAATPGSPLEPWATVADVMAAVPSIDEGKAADCIQAATEILWALTGRQFPSLRVRAVRVLAPACPCDGQRWRSGTDGTIPRELARFGLGFGWGWGCGCPLELQLPDQDARAVLEITIDGVALDPTGYRLDAGGRLVRLDGPAWPMPLSPAVAGLGITYTFGSAPPAGGKRAARLLAVAFAKDDGSACKLPQRVTSVATEGVTIALDDLKTLREGGTGLSEVDMWVHSVNPHGQTRRPQVLSPDAPRFRTAVPNP